MYPGVGTFVLIRPAQTFYERIMVERHAWLCYDAEYHPGLLSRYSNANDGCSPRLLHLSRRQLWFLSLPFRLQQHSHLNLCLPRPLIPRQSPVPPLSRRPKRPSPPRPCPLQLSWVRQRRHHLPPQQEAEAVARRPTELKPLTAVGCSSVWSR